MSYKEYEKIDAKSSYERLLENYKEWISNSDDDYVHKLDSNLVEKYKQLRECVLKRIKEENLYDLIENQNKVYKFDVQLGLILHEILDITEREATQNMYWEFLHLKVLPDVVMKRWDIEKNKNRFVMEDKDTRIYFKAIWWYVHFLLVTGTSMEEAKEILLSDKLTTDTIVAVVERTGKSGYNYKTNAELLKAIVNSKEKVTEFSRKVMYVNNAKTRSMIPAFSEGGEKEYAEKIVDEIILKEKEEKDVARKGTDKHFGGFKLFGKKRNLYK